MTAPGNHTTTKKELVNRIADRTGHTKVVVKEVLQSFLDEIIHELAVGNRLEFREFGVFEVRERRARRAQNPRTLEKVDVPAKRVVKFKVGRLMRRRVCEEPPPEAASSAAEESGAAATDGRATPARSASPAAQSESRPGGDAGRGQGTNELTPKKPPTKRSPF